ncbi:MAG: leucine--tRNA ligase [Ruminococcaceae bacterium]|nr:leucine--tRNA ligase [Oscillospiraceae bacterium]
MKDYNFSAIEKKWQKIWDDEKTFSAKDDYTMPKFYGLVEFPYPSGAGLHVGHPRSYTAMDIISRQKRLAGYNVMYTMGWDAFGLPTENFAMKNHIHPEIVTKNNVARFKQQLKMLGLSFDWDREINTTDKDYYKWTQWIFIQLYKQGLAYKKEMNVNWCTNCKVVLANEEVVNGVCERCNSEVVRKVKSQWVLKITEYADKLIDGLDDVNFIDRVVAQQKNWIGRSTGAQVRFKSTQGDEIEIYTTRPDTLFGATYMVMAPEHALVEKWKDALENYDEIVAYREAAARKSDLERTELSKEKTGVALKGVKGINPVNGKEITIFVSDYVLATYGTGAIMAVPGHDTRDWEFAKKFDLPIIEVVKGGDVEKEAFTDCETGIMTNSGFLDGLSVEDAKVKIIEWLAEQGIGESKTNYKLRDWIFSRQRYWGEPIPMVYCPHCGWEPVPEDQLPLELPELMDFEPTGEGESPLARLTDWVNTTCPKCGGPAKRETDTMPQWAGSSWYFLRYIDPKNSEALASKEAMEYWMPVDWYNGGMEHTTLHLLYSRFWHKFLYDIGAVTCPEPYAKRTSHGMILGETGEKMSKSRGNVVNPDDIVNEYGADTMRMYEMFMGDFEKAAPWSQSSIKGCKRFLDKIWNLQEMVVDGEEYSEDMVVPFNKTIKKVTEDINNLGFNTAIAAMMALINEIGAKKSINKAEYRTLLILLNPFAPHITEEIWENMGFGGQIAQAQWPSFDEAKCVEATVEVPVQVNGKIRARINIALDLSKDDMLAAAMANDAIKLATDGKTVVKTICVPNKLVNIVVK